MIMLRPQDFPAAVLHECANSGGLAEPARENTGLFSKSDPCYTYFLIHKENSRESMRFMAEMREERRGYDGGVKGLAVGNGEGG